MDSSRSGLLSTLLMTLPLIVVPAIALLRPPGQGPGVSTSRLDANEKEKQEDSDFLDEFDSFSVEEGTPRQSRNAPKTSKKTSELDNDFGGMFDDMEKPPEGPKAGSGLNDPTNQNSDPFTEVDKNPETPDPESLRPKPESPAPSEPPVSAEKIIEKLNILGAQRTFWFEAGSKLPVGLAVFFRGDTELVKIRFEAVGQTRSECARNVLDQVMVWQRQQTARRQAEQQQQ